ncbi:cAMP-dependent protein kinase catalytic subunit alpha-like [Rhodnius prolixus]
MEYIQNKYSHRSEVYYRSLIKDWYRYLEEAKNNFYTNMFSRKLPNKEVTPDNFHFIKTLGMGAFGRVMLIQNDATGYLYAAKILIKKHLVESRQVRHALNERNILRSIRFPFTIHLEFFFQDNVYLYFVMPLVEGGEMFMILRAQGRFNENMAKFYAAQVLLALEYLHFLNLVYRDLKPENILIDKDGFIKVTDFGFCKRIEGRTYTFCGTPEYMAPEILLSRGYGKSVDYWALGILIYELNCGHTPFFSKDCTKIYDKIIRGRYLIKTYFSPELKDIIKNLLQADLSRRYGTLRRGVRDIKDHRWFNRIIWIELVNKNVKPPFVPANKEIENAEFFERFQEEPSLMHKSYDAYKDHFDNF